MNELIRLTSTEGEEVIVNINLVTFICKNLIIDKTILHLANESNVVVNESVDDIINLILETRSESNERLLRHLG